MFFSTWIFGSISFFSISSCARDARAAGLHHGAVVGGARRVLLRLALADLLFEPIELGLAIERVADLLLAVELHQQIAGPDGLARRGRASVMTRVLLFCPASREW